MKPLSFFLLLLSPALLLGCAGAETKTEYPDKLKDKIYKQGSLLSDEGGSSLFGNARREQDGENSGVGVNGYLWRAALETLSFMPISGADPFGGVIITDWQSQPENPDERLKLRVVILGQELRSDAVKVSVFREVRKNDKAEFVAANVAEETPRKLEDTILNRARALRLATLQRQS